MKYKPKDTGNIWGLQDLGARSLFGLVFNGSTLPGISAGEGCNMEGLSLNQGQIACVGP